jgi:hypothetical protein
MNNKKALLVLGGLLLAIGFLKPDLTNLFKNNSPSDLNISKPTNVELLDECDLVTKALKSGGASSSESKRLASLYMDMASLVELDGEDQIVKNTDDIRQANSLSGLMLKMNIKGKYPELASAAKAVIVSSIGDDNVPLNKDLRAKAVDGFRALAWACDQGAK